MAMAATLGNGYGYPAYGYGGYPAYGYGGYPGYGVGYPYGGYPAYSGYPSYGYGGYPAYGGWQRQASTSPTQLTCFYPAGRALPVYKLRAGLD